VKQVADAAFRILEASGMHVHSETARRALWQKGIPAFLSPEPAAYTLERLAWYGTWLKRRGMAGTDTPLQRRETDGAVHTKERR
jgi:acyl-CoA synthetase (NDP forming)